MELNFKFQRNEEHRLNKLFQKMTKRHNRHHIVDEAIEVRKAKKKAQEERLSYYTYQKVPAKRSKFRKWYSNSKLKKKLDTITHKLKTKIYSYESIYLYGWHSILDFGEHVKQKKAFYAPIAAFFVLVLVGSITYQFLFGYEITFNGHNIGVVSNMTVFEDAMNQVETNLSNWYDNNNLYYEQSITIKSVFIKDRDELLDNNTCEEAIYACDFPLFVDGGIITIDGIETVKLASAEEAQEAIDLLLDDYIGESSETVEVMESEVVQNIEVEEKIIQMGTEKTVNEAVAYMKTLSSKQTTSSVKVASVSTASEGDFASIITNDNSNQGLVTALNFRSDEFSIGATTAKPVLTIKTVKEVTYEAKVPYKTTYQDDPNAYIGTESVVSEGVDGTKEVTALITYTNNAETSREVLNETVVTDPVDEVVARGSKLLPPAESTGNFVIPTSGRISTIFGTSSHAGGCAVDIATPRGTPIYASDSGVVTKVEYYGTYGNTVMIDHGNGYSTLYAHMTSFNVSVGQQVNQGQVIGYVGSTGYSTGPHLHFEIRYNNVRQPILSYFSYFAVGQYVTALH